MLHKIYVNSIQSEGDTKHGFVVSDKTVWEDIEIMFKGKPNTIANLKVMSASGQATPFYSFTRFFQFIVFLQFQPRIGWSIKLTDFSNNTDNALDEYLALKTNNWSFDDRNKIMKIFQQIQEDSSIDRGEMIIKDPID